MNAREHLSDYLLGELDAGDRARFEQALRQDPGLSAEVERLRPVVARLDALDPAAWELPGAVPPPPAVTAPARTRWWQRSLALRPLPAAALAVVLLALGIAAGVLLDRRGDTGTGRLLALAPVEPLGGAATGTARVSTDRATVHLTGVRPSEDGQFYELWLLNAPDDLVSLGSFTVPASGEVDVSVPVPGDARGFAALDVSVEPPDGDPAHSTRSVLRAPL
jgi:anti-sigma-K factor RskA